MLELVPVEMAEPAPVALDELVTVALGEPVALEEPVVVAEGELLLVCEMVEDCVPAGLAERGVLLGVGAT